MRYAFVGCSALLLAFAGPAHAEGAQEFQLHNDLRQSIVHVYVSAIGGKHWATDLLGGEPIASGEFAKITFAGRADSDCHFDVKVVTSNQGSWVVQNLDTCAMIDLTLSEVEGKVVYRKN